MKKFRNTLKSVVLLFCYLLAFLFGIKKKPSILMYHSFDNEDWRYGVSPSDLERQIVHLKNNYKFVNLNEIVAYVKGEKSLSNNSIALTIDDGYEDTYKVFYPLAKEHKIPFTLFLTTDLEIKPNLGNLARPNLEQLREMQQSGLVTFGLHGKSHIHFPEVFNKNLISEEILDSEAFLYKITGTPTQFVAYPSGRYDERVLQYFKTSMQYLAGLAIHSGFVKPGDDPFRLRRIEVSRNVDSLLLFKLRLTPALEVYNWIIAKFKKLI